MIQFHFILWFRGWISLRWYKLHSRPFVYAFLSLNILFFPYKQLNKRPSNEYNRIKHVKLRIWIYLYSIYRSNTFFWLSIMIRIRSCCTFLRYLDKTFHFQIITNIYSMLCCWERAQNNFHITLPVFHEVVRQAWAEMHMSYCISQMFHCHVIPAVICYGVLLLLNKI